MMADFTFYTQEYLGTQIPQKAFDGVIRQAGAVLNRLRRIYRVADCTPAEENMALCAMAESIYAWEKCRGGISGASVGSVSVSYDRAEDREKALSRELYRKAAIYLDIYRGVGQ